MQHPPKDASNEDWIAAYLDNAIWHIRKAEEYAERAGLHGAEHDLFQLWRETLRIQSSLFALRARRSAAPPQVPGQLEFEAR